MEREKRTLFLVFLTLAVYGLSIFLQEGQFILPFPLFEFLFFFVCVQFVLWNRTQILASSFVIAAGLFQLVSAPTMWTFFLDTSQMMTLDESSFFDLSKLLFYLVVFAGGIATAIKQKRTLHWLLLLIFCAFLIPGVLFNHWVIALAYLTMSISTHKHPAFAPFDYLWFLLFILDGSYWLILFVSA